MSNLPQFSSQRRPKSKYYVAEETGYESGTGFVEIKVESGLGYAATAGYFINDGPGNCKCKITYKSGDGGILGAFGSSGVYSGSIFTLKAGETFYLSNQSVVSSWYVSYSGTSGNYRAFFA